jgi:ABC-type multidrug transport system ATPase subunit
VAIALIGDPKVVYLDEPSTGLDPASRRKLWEVIRSHSRTCSVVLTTHSMEEAEVLCDRITIMADGVAKCIGTGSELKRAHVSGYVPGLGSRLFFSLSLSIKIYMFALN